MSGGRRSLEGGPGFVLRGSRPYGTAAERFTGRIDGYLPAQGGVLGASRGAHAALAELFEEAIMRECTADHVAQHESRGEKGATVACHYFLAISA